MNTTLIVDGTNNFLRNYTVVPSLDSNGQPIGGVVGFLKSLRHFIEISKPDRVIIVFDGEGGSTRRRKIFPEYKSGRKPPRLNREYQLDESKELQCKHYQSIRLRMYLENLPVSLVEIKDIEADDAIACLNDYFSDDRKVIASNDQDFCQLLNEQTIIYKPTKKVFYTTKHCIEDFGVHPINMALARAIIGDKSDSIPGIKQVGWKTLIKLFPDFALCEKLDIDHLLAICKQNDNVRYSVFLEQERLLRDNYKIMRLDEPLISAFSMSAIKSSIKDQPGMNSTSLKVKLRQDGINDITPSFFQTFSILSHRGKQNT